jgi:hypothetical protein
VDNRDQRPGPGACAPSVIVDKRCDAGSEIRLAAGSRSEGGLGGNLNSDIARGAEGSRKRLLLLHVWSCRRDRCHRRRDSAIQNELPYALGDLAIVLDRRVDRGALMKLSCHFGTALEWDNTIGSVRFLTDNAVSKQCLFVRRAIRVVDTYSMSTQVQVMPYHATKDLIRQHILVPEDARLTSQ